MFDTLEEAQELNSECSFCGLPKFIVRPELETFSGTNVLLETRIVGYALIRCGVEGCTKHCMWGHKGVTIEMRIADRDSVELISGR